MSTDTQRVGRDLYKVYHEADRNPLVQCELYPPKRNYMRDPCDFEQFRREGHRVIDMLADYLESLPDRPAFQPVPANLPETYFASSIPAEGADMASILDEVEMAVLPYPLGNGHPRFWGWVNSPPTPVGILADAIAATMNPSCAGGNHAAIYVERQVIHWLKQIVGYPAEAGGLLVSGGSTASLTGLAVARSAKAGFDVRTEGLQGASIRLALYASNETHSAVRKSVELLGLGSRSLRLIPANDDMQMNVSALRGVIDKDKKEGVQPLAVIASAGTASTGSIDPLDEIADVCDEHQMWLHVDGAYGAVAVLSRHYREILAPLSRADSIALDPHKWLGVPVEAGAILVRDEAAMRNTFRLVPPYIQSGGESQSIYGPTWYSELGFQQTRGFRALKVWMSLKNFGLNRYARMIEKHIDLARLLADLVSGSENLELVISPSLSIVCFRYVPSQSAGGKESVNGFNQALLTQLQLGGVAFVSSTVVGDVFALRACIVNSRTTEQDVRILVDHVEELGRRMEVENTEGP